jgi:hypothetical protein
MDLGHLEQFPMLSADCAEVDFFAQFRTENRFALFLELLWQEKRPGAKAARPKMKVMTFRGEHRPAQWEENTGRYPLCGL